MKEQNEMSNNGYDYFIIQIDSDYSISKGYLCIYTDSYLINNNKEIEIEKGKYSLLYVNFESPLKHYILASSNKNAILLDDYLFESKNLTNLIIYYNDDIGYYYNHEYRFAYVDSSYEKTTLKFYSYMHYNTLVSKFNLKLLLNTDLYTFFNRNNVDSIFIRNISNNMHFGYNSIYFFDINENYYLYIKKFYGNIDFYQYNQELNSLTEISKLNIPIESYEDSNLYKLINNELIIISGYQLISFFTTYNTLFDIYFQKVDDFENIEINPQIFKYNNLVKLLKENKKYNLNFKVDHLIKLDDGFLNAVVKFSDNNGNQYILDNLHKVINIKGEKIKVISTNNNALLYFYQRIEDESSIKVIEFDKNQKGKNMKFVIENLYSNEISISIAKDLSFKGYYPMLNTKNVDIIKTKKSMTTIYIENILDKLNEYKLYENEKYLIYIFDSINEKGFPTFNSDNYYIGDINYVNNLMTPENKYNFEVIPANPKGSIILNSVKKEKINYQFFICKNNEIKFKLRNIKGYFLNESISYPYEEIINENKNIYFYINNQSDTLINSFESNYEFLFIYSFYDKENGFYEFPDSEPYSYIDLSLSVKEITYNNLEIKFKPSYSSYLNKYYIIVGKKTESNNKDSFSNPCYISKLIIENND